MKISTKGFIGVAVIFCATTAWSGQTQHVAPGEVPEGLTAEDWGIVQEAYLKAFNTDAGDEFYEVAISGDTIVVGANEEDSNATGINGNQSDNSKEDSGAAYVFVRNGTTWSHQAYLKASHTDAGDHFGYSVSISGDTIVVGAVLEDSNATGINGNQTDNSAQYAGAAYVFVRNGTTWSQQAYLKSSNSGAGDRFGFSVAIAGDTIVVGAWAESSNATGVNGNQSDNSKEDSGAAYVFVRNGTTWSHQTYLKASNTDAYDRFGSSVAIFGDTAIIGAYSESSNATGINGNQANNSAVVSGAAYVFVRSGMTWSQQAYLKASNTDSGDQFGSAVAIFGDTAIIGAVAENSNATGINGNQSDNSYSVAGAAYVFTRNKATWSQQAYLKASNTDAADGFGCSVSIYVDIIVIGATGEGSSATDINGNQVDNSAGASGAAYVFARNGTTWSQQAYLKASNTDQWDAFGRPVAISGGTIVVGAINEESNVTGVNGNQADNSAGGAGAAYVFTGFSPGDYQATITNCYLVATGFVLEWIPVSGWDSVVQCSTDLALTPFTDLSAALPYPVNTYTDTVTGAESKCFYRVDLQP